MNDSWLASPVECQTSGCTNRTIHGSRKCFDCRRIKSARPNEAKS